ncbi:hypothetical protein CEJ57_14875 [Acinetobacter baumannii]|nr:hypothetical protein CEJ57_14875 [Acinetobacter baumannii]
MELHYCETVKKAASGVMDARQHEVPAKELHDIANHLEEQQAKQLYQELLCTRQISQNPYPIRVLPS